MKARCFMNINKFSVSSCKIVAVKCFESRFYQHVYQCLINLQVNFERSKKNTCPDIGHFSYSN